MKVEDLLAELSNYDPELYIVSPTGDHQYENFYGFSLGTIGLGGGEMYEAFEEDHLRGENHRLVEVLVVSQ